MELQQVLTCVIEGLPLACKLRLMLTEKRSFLRYCLTASSSCLRLSSSCCRRSSCTVETHGRAAAHMIVNACFSVRYQEAGHAAPMFTPFTVASKAGVCSCAHLLLLQLCRHVCVKLCALCCARVCGQVWVCWHSQRGVALVHHKRPTSNHWPRLQATPCQQTGSNIAATYVLRTTARAT